jgi:hypothetical protein
MRTKSLLGATALAAIARHHGIHPIAPRSNVVSA